MQIVNADSWEGHLSELQAALIKPLQDKQRVLWLICGGSNIASSVQVMDAIPDELSEQLTFMLTDERYGNEGHADSNWRQLDEAGFQAKRAKAIPALQDQESLVAVVDRYNVQLADALESNDIVIAQYGIGPDGHIAGILPDSPAAHETGRLVSGYDGGAFTRITMTFPAILQVESAFAFAFGDAKQPAMRQLANDTIDVVEQPAQILKQLPEAYLYTDQLKEETS